jgi:hypothetical protein
VFTVAAMCDRPTFIARRARSSRDTRGSASYSSWTVAACVTVTSSRIPSAPKMMAARSSPPRSRSGRTIVWRKASSSEPWSGLKRAAPLNSEARMAARVSDANVPSAAAAVERRAPSVRRNVTKVTADAATTASQSGSHPANTSGTTTFVMTASVSASAISERTPRQPPTSVTAKAKMPRSTAIVGIRQRSLTAMNSPSGSGEIATITSSPTSNRGASCDPVGPCSQASLTSPVRGPDRILTRASGSVGSVPGGWISMSRAWTSSTSGKVASGGGLRSGRMNRPTSSSSPTVRARAWRRSPWSGMS